MITPQEIKAKALKRYTYVLQAYSTNTDIFPLLIPSNKGKTSDPFSQRVEALKLLFDHSKARLGYGYSITLKEIETRKDGKQSQVEAILFDTETDFLKFIDKQEEFEQFKTSLTLIRLHLPQLEEWLRQHIQHIIEYTEQWVNIIKVCQYFLAHPQPQLYIRELPIAVDTKFIETHKAIIKDILDSLLTKEHINQQFNGLSGNNFERRFHLKFDEEPLVRLRFLDKKLYMNQHISDISLLPSEFIAAEFPCEKVIIAENKINFLTLPSIADCIAIWGHGYSISQLKGSQWLQTKPIYYWGDLDTDGLQILAQVRSYYPHVIGVMMDFETLNDFAAYVGEGEKTNVRNLEYLTAEEMELFEYLKTNNLRLEQEKIPQHYANKKLYSIFPTA